MPASVGSIFSCSRIPMPTMSATCLPCSRPCPWSGCSSQRRTGPPARWRGCGGRRPPSGSNRRLRPRGRAAQPAPLNGLRCGRGPELRPAMSTTFRSSSSSKRLRATLRCSWAISAATPRTHSTPPWRMRVPGTWTSSPSRITGRNNRAGIWRSGCSRTSRSSQWASTTNTATRPPRRSSSTSL